MNILSRKAQRAATVLGALALLPTGFSAAAPGAGSRRIFFVAAATVVAGDLALKAALVARGGGVLFHPRSAAAGVLVCVATAILGAATLRVGSRALGLAAGILVGAGVANVASGVLWPGVPDYLALDGVLFNLADAAALVGACAMVLVALWLLAQQVRST